MSKLSPQWINSSDSAEHQAAIGQYQPSKQPLERVFQDCPTCSLISITYKELP